MERSRCTDGRLRKVHALYACFFRVAGRQIEHAACPPGDACPAHRALRYVTTAGCRPADCRGLARRVPAARAPALGFLARASIFTETM